MKTLRTIVESDFSKPWNVERNELEHTHGQLAQHYVGYDEYQHNDVREYTGGWSKATNNHLWEKHKGEEPGESADEYYGSKIKTLDSALAKHGAPKKLTVYSGIKYDPRTRMDEKRIVQHPAYLSTSISKGMAKGFGYSRNESSPLSATYHVLKIKVPKGHPGAYVDHFSKNDGEHEFILPRGMKLRYLHTQTHKNPDPNNCRETIHEHHMEIVK